MLKIVHLTAIACVAIVLSADVVHAERLCDSSRESCRTPLLTLISNERQGIDVGFWFMEDVRYARALVDAHNRGVRVRVIVDTKASKSYPANATMLQTLRDGGVPMRRAASRYFHWKMMLFDGQNVVEFGSANYSPHAFVPVEPLVDFIDETILFSDDPAIVNSFRTKFDEHWINTSAFSDYANVSTPLTRAYPVYTISSALNFPPSQNFGTRSVGRYNAETVAIDVIIFRMGDRRHADAMIAAHQRGVPVRIYTEQNQYRDPKRPLHAYDVDRLYAAGVQIRHRDHGGSNHQKLTLLRGQRMAIFGSQNWTHTAGQYEHNYFTTKPHLYDWLSDLFDRKWVNETQAFVPQPPTTPQYRSPANGSQIDTSSVTLRWYAGLWAHKYDIYFGTSSNPPLVAADLELGYSRSTSDLKSYTVTGLAPNTTYYWRIVSKTMANRTRGGSIWTVHTSGSGTTTSASLPSGWQSRDIGSVGVAGSASENSGSFTVRGAGADIWGTSDAFHFAYRSLSGDGTITARVASVSGSEAWTKVGVMIRGSTSASAAHAFMLVSKGRGLRFQRRTTAGGLSASTDGGSGTAPRWVRLSRSGNRITAYVSSTGSSWTVVGSDTFSMSSTVLVGLAVSSHTTSSLATGVFDNVSVSGP